MKDSDAEPASQRNHGQDKKQQATSDLFYKQQKDTDRNVLSGNEDDLWDEPDSVVAEVKASKKPNMKVSESDFENDTSQG